MEEIEEEMESLGCQMSGLVWNCLRRKKKKKLGQLLEMGSDKEGENRHI